MEQRNCFGSQNKLIIDVCWLVGFYGISNPCRLFNAKSFMYIYIKYIQFRWVYGTSTLVGYLMLKPLYRYILNSYDSVGLGFMAY